MRFEFATATRIIFGRGTERELGALCLEHGRRALLVTGSHPDRIAPIRERLEADGLTTSIFSISGEPTVNEVERGVTHGVDMVIGIGGGSAIDAGKAIAAMSTQKGTLLDYLEIVGRGRPLDAKPLPYFAVPTTAGTGAEVTRNAVLASPEHQVKASLRHAWMLPTVALVDPDLARDCPPAVTAASGMDALTQCLEAFVSCRAQPLTDALCIDGIRRAARSLERAVKDGNDMEAREDLALAALYSGIALANAGLGAVHGFAAPIGGRYQAPHGAVCAALLAPVWETNARLAGGAKFAQVDQLLGGDAITYLHDLTKRLAIPGLSAHGVGPGDVDAIVEKAAQASSMKGNPVKLSHEVLRAILLAAL